MSHDKPSFCHCRPHWLRQLDKTQKWQNMHATTVVLLLLVSSFSFNIRLLATKWSQCVSVTDGCAFVWCLFVCIALNLAMAIDQQQSHLGAAYRFSLSYMRNKNMPHVAAWISGVTSWESQWCREEAKTTIQNPQSGRDMHRLAWFVGCIQQKTYIYM